MTDLFRCDYCGALTEIHKAQIFWETADKLDDGITQTWIPAVYCSPYCGRSATARSGAGRG